MRGEYLIPYCVVSGLWNYLRVRGEYACGRVAVNRSKELPPRARRILDEPELIVDEIGTTSACAENTSPDRSVRRHPRNYLRVRGEYTSSKASFSAFVELPPRARRIQPANEHLIEPMGTTSACAENTAHPLDAARLIGNYLRVRGEYPGGPFGGGQNMELPPRARRIRQFQQLSSLSLGTTSACAENTTRFTPLVFS